MRTLLSALLSLPLAPLLSAAAPLLHADFEHGLGRWTTRHSWYEKPKGSGLSRITAARGQGRNGSTALEIRGAGNRGIAMRVFPAFPGKYRVSGWIRCKNMGKSQAGVLLEWLDRKNRWMRGDHAVRVQGDTPWKHFDAVIPAPPGTRSLHFDLLTYQPNHGAVWFDDIRLERLKQGLPRPAPPRITAITQPGETGCLEIRWNEKTLSPGCIRLLVYCAPAGAPSPAVPRAVMDTGTGMGRLRSLAVGQTYRVSARAVNADGEVSPPGPAATATVRDREPPHPGWLTARMHQNRGEVRIGWRPHVLDSDLARIHFLLDPGAGPPRTLRTAAAKPIFDTPRPFYCTAPWYAFPTPLPAAQASKARIGVFCEDRAGNRSQTAWVPILPPAGPGPAPCELRMAPPTAQVRRNAPWPPHSGKNALPALRLMRGQAKGFQVLLYPRQPLHDVHAVFEPLRPQTTAAKEIPARWIAAHFVRYVHLPKNSRATPASELVWPAPADYPDELSDAPALDLAPDGIHPLYVRVTAPSNAVPGRYVGRGFILCREGRLRFEFPIRIEPVSLPDRLRLKFVYWFSWSDVCRRFKVARFSEDGWRLLARLGALMKAHHQNVVRVPWSLIRTWQTPDGRLVNDFRDFDRFLRTFQAAGVDRMFCLHHIGGRATGAWNCPTMKSHSKRVTLTATGEDRRIDVLEILPAIERHIRNLKLLPRFAVHVADEPIPVNLASYRKLAAQVKARAPGLRRIDAIHVPDLQGSLEIWVPQLNYFEKWLPRYRAAQRAGNELWFYVAWVPQGKYPNRMIDSAAIKPRILHWLNALYNTSGYLHWALNDWHISLMSHQSPGDQYICWPSRRFIADSSLRYEAEREGLEDCELMFMLEKHWENAGMRPETARKRLARLVRPAVRDFQHYTRSWESLERVRGSLLDALEQ